METNDTNVEASSNSETREIVTPYAFTVSPHLLGHPLASPMRRGIAILIDLFLISVLSSISALIFAVFVALTFFRADARLKQKSKTGARHATRKLLRGSGAVIIFIIAWVVVQGFNKNDNSVNVSDSKKAQIAEVVVFYACQQDMLCIEEEGIELASELAKTDLQESEFNQLMRERIDDMPWDEQDKVNMLNLFDQIFTSEKIKYEIEHDAPSVDAGAANNTQNQAASPSLIAWVEGIMADLGLGLGWAALYFSVFTAWANGQTIGKKLCKIRVVKLDGTAPNLWESFGRYGGYGAGFATGLLGFLQLYWDPNRQAIQDKISETLVLRIQAVASITEPTEEPKDEEQVKA